MKEKSIPNFRVLSVLLAAFLVGVFVASFFDLDFQRIYFLAIVFSLIILAGNFLFRGFLVKIASTAAIIFFSGFLLFSFVGTKLNNADLPFDQEKEFTGTITSYPNVDGNKQSFYLQTSDFGSLAKFYMSTSRFPTYSYGDKLNIKSTIKKPVNFSDFDWVSYLKRYAAVATTESNPEISLISSDNGNKILAKLYVVRRSFEKAVQKTLPEPESSLGIGLLIGSKQGFSQNLIDDFARVGITHIIALSGYNVTIIIIFLTDILLGFLTRRQIFVVSLILILLFVAMTGAAPSVIRASIITLLIAYGKTIGRKADMTNLILLSAAIMVAINPFVLRFDVGFQLSFLAFIGLVYFSPIVSLIFNRRFFKPWPKPIKSAIVETFSAQMIVLPLILSSFGLVSLIAPLTNVLILPLIPAAMLFIFLSTLIFWAIPAIGKLAFLICYLPLKYIIVIAQYFSKLPISAIQISGQWQTIVVVAYIVIVVAIFIKYRNYADQETV